MTRPEHIDQAYVRLQELDQLTDYPTGSDEWWGVVGAEVGMGASELQAACQEIAPKQLDLWPATRGLLIGLLAARYASVEAPA